MTAVVTRLLTRPDRLHAEQAEALRQMVLAFPELPERAAGEIIAAIDSQIASDNGWTFVMLSPAQNRAVVKWIRANSKYPLIAVELWAELFVYLRRDTGDIMQTRDELSDLVGAPADKVSRIMTELESVGVITRRRIKIGGMKGPGMVRYRMNPVVATHLKGAARDSAQAAAPQLRVVP